MEKNKLFNMLQYVIFAFQITRTMLTNDEQKPGRKTEPKNHFVEIPSGKRLHNYGKIHHVQWENPLFLWPFSMGITTSPCFVRKAGPGTFFFGRAKPLERAPRMWSCHRATGPPRGWDTKASEMV